MKALCLSVIVTLIAAGCGDDVSGNAPPVFRGTLQLTTSEDTAGMTTIDAYDPDGLTVTLAIGTPPEHGTATIAGAIVTYTPSANYNGADTLGVTASDGTLSATSMIAIHISPVNDPPVGSPDAYVTQEDVPLVVATSALLANDTDVDGDPLLVSAVSSPTGGTVALSGGTVTFTPFPNSSGAAVFMYTLSDGTAHVEVPVQVTVGAVNDPPVAVDDTATTAEDTPAMISVATLTANDTDADGPTPMVTAVANATDGTATLAGGFVTFTPARDFAGTAGFDYTASDGSATDTGHVTVTVTPVEDPPVAIDDTATTPLGTPVVLTAATLLANDTDPDQGAMKTLTVVQNPQHGTVMLVGTTITFTPAVGFVGAASFDYVVSDGMLTDVGTVVVTVTPICGDSLVSLGEGCDDGALLAGDGCSPSCTVELGWTCAASPSVCQPICGDGLVRGSEPCDDGDLDETNGCTTSCVVGVVCNASALPGADRFAVIPSSGTCFAAFDADPLSFAASEASCVALGGHLATITSASEQAAVHAVHAGAQTPYIGAMDDANDTDTVFDWVTDEPWGFTSFAAGQPDDGPAGDGECLVLTGATSGWADVSCVTIGAATGRICELERDACGDGIVQAARGEQCDDGGFVPGDGCDPTCLRETLYISEYIEGSSNNKAVEIANPLTTPFDLAANACVLKLFSNGSATATNTLPLTGVIAGGDVFVACNTSSTAAIIAQCDLTNGGVMAYNGDDALTLECNGTVLDSIGQVGVDPGTEWGTGLTSTADNTLRRACGITHGDVDPTDAYDPAPTFRGFALDTFGDLGVATCAP